MSVPRLRFKEFSGPWEVETLGDIFNIVVGFVGTVSNSYCEESDGIPFIRTLNVKNGWFSLDDIQFVTKSFHISNKKSQIYNDDILIARVGANMGMVCKVNSLKKEANSANVIIIKSNLKSNSDFYSLYLSSPKGQKQIQAKGAGGAQEVLNISVAKTIIVPVPSLQEQTKIANFLMAVDEKIAQLTRKADLLSRYKKGVMQQIFSQQLRFKEDNEKKFPEWEEKKLADVATIVGGGTPDTTEKGYWNGNIQWFTPTELKTKYISESQRTITANGLKSSSAKILPVGTLLFSSRATVGDVSIALNECSTNQGFQSLIVNNENFNQFVYYWILNNKNLFIEKASGSTFLEISKKEIEKLKIKTPTLPEQTKIANFLIALDDKISHNRTQLNALKRYKQGLLQQLFV